METIAVLAAKFGKDGQAAAAIDLKALGLQLDTVTIQHVESG